MSKKLKEKFWSLKSDLIQFRAEYVNEWNLTDFKAFTRIIRIVEKKGENL